MSIVNFANHYKILHQQKFSFQQFSLVPIRFEDRHKIMKWRNEQIYHLRQNKPITVQEQDSYFINVVSKLFDQDQPKQLLFSFLKDGVCIGYGGLVHINWIDYNAEISFLIDTSLQKENFDQYWKVYLSMINEVAFDALGLHKIYTYAFDLRPHLYPVLDQSGFQEDARLKEHCCFNNTFIDVVIHSKFNPELSLRKADFSDFEITYKWASSPIIRQFSFDKSEITHDIHRAWFNEKINNPQTLYYILMSKNIKVGSIRFDRNSNEDVVISYLIDPEFHGKGLGRSILRKGINLLFSLNWNVKTIIGYVLRQNKASVKIFEQLGFDLVAEDDHQLKFQKKYESTE